MIIAQNQLCIITLSLKSHVIIFINSSENHHYIAIFAKFYLQIDTFITKHIDKLRYHIS